MSFIIKKNHTFSQKTQHNKKHCTEYLHIFASEIYMEHLHPLFSSIHFNLSLLFSLRFLAWLHDQFSSGPLDNWTSTLA